MKARWLTLVSAVSLAVALSAQAAAKPPEEEALDRAERAAERAAKAAERASEAAERAAERDQRDRDTQDGNRGGGGRGGRERDSELELASADASGRQSVETNDAADADGSNSGSGQGGSEETPDTNDPDSNSGSNSGSGNGEVDDPDDTSGHGSGGDDEDEDDADEDEDKRDRQGVIVPVENDDAGNPYREGELVIMSDDAGLVARAEALGFGVIEARELVSIGSVVARLRRPEGVGSTEALEMLRTREPASPSGYNYIYRAAGDAPEAPYEEQRSPAPGNATSEIRVGIIDGFSSSAIGEWPVERLVDTPALKGHGEAVTAILLRDLANTYRLKPDQLVLLDVMRQHGGTGAADVAALVLAFDRLVTKRIDFANLSLAGPDHPALRRTIQMSLKAGMVIVAAVGNEGPAAPPAFPAAYDGVVGVAAVDDAGRPYLYSGRGAHVDIAALGVEVSPAGPGGELMGTSYAAPHVTAMLAGNAATGAPTSVETLLATHTQDAGPPGRDPIYGLGILTLSPKVSLAQASEGHQ